MMTRVQETARNARETMKEAEDAMKEAWTAMEAGDPHNEVPVIIARAGLLMVQARRFHAEWKEALLSEGAAMLLSLERAGDDSMREVER